MRSGDVLRQCRDEPFKDALRLLEISFLLRFNKFEQDENRPS